jgi:hypothetical protein
MNDFDDIEQSPEPYEGDDAENWEREQVARDISLGEGREDLTEEEEDDGLSDDANPDESDDEGGVAGDFDDDGPRFARAGSALRAASASNPRNCPCPTCKRPNKLTPADVAAGYQCDICADAAEGHGP